MRIAFSTLGCKINQYETDLMRQELQSRGNTIVPFDADADVYIINTCSVTAKSDYQCRQVIRSASRRGKGAARIVVTGCYAETRPEEIRKIPGVDLVIGNRDKASLPARVMDADIVTTQSAAGAPAKPLRSRTRGFLKIQDGCDNRCSYCIVPFARGGSRSVIPEDIHKEFEGLVKTGCPEIVLTGIHVGTYGTDLKDGTDLTGLLTSLLAKRGNSRIRLSSIEPGEITSEMIGLLGKGLCRHLHIPLQSGDDAILTAMKRNYTAGFYLDLLGNIARSAPDVALGSDVMAGFPGEGDREFQNTLRLVEESPLTHLHVFSYSPRPGTVAAEMKNQVPEPVKKRRSEALRELGRSKNLAFRKRCSGSVLEAVVEDKIDAETGLLTGLTDNYLRVHVEGAKKENIGKVITVTLAEVNENTTTAIAW